VEKKQINEIDLHGIRHQKALDLISQTLYRNQLQGSFSLTIITGNSSYLQKIIFDEILEGSQYKYYIPNWNLGQIIVEYIEL
tara:strand:+ start:432 stop:677 length:246 start_codon:yes stop_codon:yes gene_type:complete